MVLLKAKKILLDPLFNNNPIALQVLGICSALAVTVKLKTTLVMCGGGDLRDRRFQCCRSVSFGN